jgi:hypothetical protein
MKKTLLVLLVGIASLALIGCIEKQEDEFLMFMDGFSETIDQDTSETLLLSEEPNLEDGPYAELIGLIRDEHQALVEQKRLLKESYDSLRETGRSFREEGLELEETDLETLGMLRREGRTHANILKRTYGTPWALVLAIRETDDQDEIISHLESIHGLLRMRAEHLTELTGLFNEAEEVLSPYLNI